MNESKKYADVLDSIEGGCGIYDKADFMDFRDDWLN
jgi:hypothetical protein